MDRLFTSESASKCTTIVWLGLISLSRMLLFPLLLLQVLGGVSEEQAAEAAHQRSKEKGEDMDEDEGVVEEGEDGDGDADDGVEAMDEDDQQEVRFRNLGLLRAT